jgi:hypothetical protein
MKLKDLIFTLCVIAFFLPFALIPEVMDFYKQFNSDHAYIMSAIKFAVLATLGEVIGLRIKTGNYSQKGFGLLPRAMVWAVLGISIKMAFVIFAAGAPKMLASMGVPFPTELASNPSAILGQSIFETKSWLHVLSAFSVSASMNIFFAPIFMTFHKMTDTHIMETGGTIPGFFGQRIQFGRILGEINWKVQWGFVFMKTIPFFWIPAHTITFMMPPETRILIAAVLGIVLGVFMAISAVMQQKKS